MARRRRPSTPAVDALDRGVDWSRAATLASQGLPRWVLGTGLLSLHVAAFVVVGLGMLLWNILRDPADITVTGPLTGWGVVLAAHAAAVGVGMLVRRVVSPPAARPAYRPLPRALPREARPTWTGEPMAVTPSPDGSRNGHLPHAPAAWPEPPRSVVTSRRVTTLVVATARDGFASARRRYRRQQQTGPMGGTAQSPWAGAAPTRSPNGALAASNGVHHQAHQGVNDHHPATNGHDPSANGLHPRVDGDGAGWQADPAAGSTWMAAISRDEVISVTQVGADGGDGAGDAVHSWLDGYLDGHGQEREARWTWVEAAASTWLARGDAPEPALSAASGARGDDGVAEGDAAIDGSTDVLLDGQVAAVDGVAVAPRAGDATHDASHDASQG